MVDVCQIVGYHLSQAFVHADQRCVNSFIHNVPLPEYHIYDAPGVFAHLRTKGNTVVAMYLRAGSCTVSSIPGFAATFTGPLQYKESLRFACIHALSSFSRLSYLQCNLTETIRSM